MSAMAIVSLILTIIGGVVSLLTTGLVSAVNTQKKKIEELETENAKLTALVKAGDEKVQVSVDDAVKKREETISMLKKEIEEMEKELASNTDPAAVRSRLSKLLSVP